MTKSSHECRAYSTANYTISAKNLRLAANNLKRDFPQFTRKDRRNIFVMSRYLDAFTYRQITFHFNFKLKRVK